MAKIRFYQNLYVKRKVLNLEMDMVQEISNAVINRIPKMKTIKNLRKNISDLAVQMNLDSNEQNSLFIQAANLYNDISKKSYAKIRWLKRRDIYTEENVFDTVYGTIRARIQNNDLIKLANQVMYSYEHRRKRYDLYSEEGLLENATSPFFLCSSHPKPAKDHQEWEGKMYYDEFWEEKNEYSDEEKEAIRAYIRNRKLETIQWVTGEPVFLVTRRNCKHYFKNIPLEKVLHSSPKALLKKYKMYHESSLPITPAVAAYREYYSRAKVEEELNQIIPCTKLKKDLKKDKFLLDKWKNLL